MITVRARVHPALDQVADARSFLTEWVEMLQAGGHNLALTQRIYSSEGPVLIVARRFADMAAADANRRANQADARWQGRLATLSAMLRSPILQTVEESVIAVTPPTQVGVVRRIFFGAAQGTVGDLRSRLAEYVQGLHTRGQTAIGLSQQVFSSDGPRLVITTVHADMAALEDVSKARRSEAQALLAATAPLCRGPVAVRLLEVVVPYPR